MGAWRTLWRPAILRVLREFDVLFCAVRGGTVSRMKGSPFVPEVPVQGLFRAPIASPRKLCYETREGSFPAHQQEAHRPGVAGDRAS